ncbi:hypothetical protein [Mesobacillus jeotgali]|uniref:hypothetical protein n=1 Tax=Mesobacillus jeotgali TaxID=129985 RepID=UPI0009A704F7|nr:hypothetical protein [Mesobacillus jeotgali]
MKFNKRPFVITALILLLFALNTFGPYNVLTALTANNLAEYPELQQELEGKIVDIDYKGRGTYQVITDSKDYIIVEIHSQESVVKYKVYELSRGVEIYKNPM